MLPSSIGQCLALTVVLVLPAGVAVVDSNSASLAIAVVYGLVGVALCAHLTSRAVRRRAEALVLARRTEHRLALAARRAHGRR
ncbi:hypothetical protein [Acuticoccus sp. I52.16.1]|uniref:hypothetical protein n=1 Tax=Acuticoccus sp. I52.16.1 TaxID=2928472 RepID=UPI001FD0DCD0|nr:hypothetical protein [Acuticoccus sp. I52.16.1]UOM33122.1 hypothetical protein MRB58_14745 [Acuticoccus sp. I52.16.1]